MFEALTSCFSFFLGELWLGLLLDDCLGCFDGYGLHLLERLLLSSFIAVTSFCKLVMTRWNWVRVVRSCWFCCWSDANTAGEVVEDAARSSSGVGTC